MLHFGHKEHKGPNVYRTARRAYIWNYVLTSLVLVFLGLLIVTYNLQFSIIPYNITVLWNTMLILLVLAVGAGFAEEPIMKGMMKYYYITQNEVVQIEGLIRRKKFILPFQGIADVRVTKGILGRIFKFGDVEIVGFKDSIHMKGMADPDHIQDIVQKKMNQFRPSMIRREPAVHEEEK